MASAEDLLEEMLEKQLELVRAKKGSEKETMLQVGDLSLDLQTPKITRAGKEIELTSKEYALLEYLMRNADKVVTRTMISEHVWDIDFDTFTNVIDVYINYLRNTIDSNSKKKLIQTVRGRGYILKD